MTLYDRLEARRAVATVRLNRAVAVGMAPAHRRASPHSPATPDHPLRRPSRADLLRRLGRPTEAAAAYREALTRTANEAERAYLEGRLHA